MKLYRESADASFYYHQDAAADFARLDSTAVPGNLADAMKNSVMRLPEIQSVAEVEPIPFYEISDLESD